MKYKINNKNVKSYRSTHLHKFDKDYKIYDESKKNESMQLIKYCKPCKPSMFMPINDFDTIYMYINISFNKQTNTVIMRYLTLNNNIEQFDKSEQFNKLNSTLISNTKILPTANLDIDLIFDILTTKTIHLNDKKKLEIIVVKNIFNPNIFKYKIETIVFDMNLCIFDASETTLNLNVLKTFFELNKIYYRENIIENNIFSNIKQIQIQTDKFPYNKHGESIDTNNKTLIPEKKVDIDQLEDIDLILSRMII